MTFRFLGTGTSVGVPMIGCACPTCTSSDPRDRRFRCGAYVRSGGTAVLIDTPPELRLACVAFGVDRVDAVALTHAHMDHVAAFDDVRRFNTLNGTKVACAPDEPGANGRTWRIIGKPMTCYAMPETAEQMHRIFPYIGTQGGANGLFRPQIGFDTAPSFTVGDIAFARLAVEHGFPCCGYLVGPADAADNGARLAYVSDCHVLPPETLARLRGVGTLVLNCLHERPHPTHLNLSQALAYVAEVAPRRAYLTHFSHEVSHAEWLAKLPAGVLPAYDGLELTI